jgi:hypothetical protein
MSLTVSKGQVFDNSQPFIAKGINIYADVLMSVGAATVTNTFPGLNFLRVNVFNMSADTAAKLKPYVDSLTSKGVVVELEDHNSPTVLSGQALNTAVERYTDWATVFKGNPYVVFGTQNEPVGSGASIDSEISAIYNAIRATGNNNLVLMNPNSGNSTTGLTASNYTSMTNVAWDIHYYSELSGYSMDLGANETAVANEVAGTLGIKSANGVIPVIFGEYGPATGNGPQPGGDQSVTAVEASGLGSAAWAWETGSQTPYLGDLVKPPWTGGPSMLTSYGQTVAQFIASGHPSPIAGDAHLYIASGQSVDLTNRLLALDTPSLPGDSLTLTAIGGSSTLGTTTLSGGDLSYTAPASGSTDAFTYSVSDQLNDSATGSVNVSITPNLNTAVSIGLTGVGNIVVGGDGNDVISGNTQSDWISLGNGGDTVSLFGNGNSVRLGSGDNVVSMPGSNSSITVGNGSDIVSVGGGNSVTLGSGDDTIRTGGGSESFVLNGSNASLVLRGSNNKIVINGGSDQIVDSGTDSLLLQVGQSGGTIMIDNFSAPNGVVDLATAIASSFNWTNPTQIGAALTSDHGGGSLLSLGSYGSIDFIGVAPATFHGFNFQIG